jgi:hypothetical protein
MATGRKSQARREALALDLAAGWPAKEAAARNGVSERTAGLWRKEPAFAARVEELRAQLLEQAMAVLVSGTTGAAAVLRKLLESADERVRLRAAQQVLEQATRLREAVTLEERVRLLEQDAAARARRGAG